MDPESAALRCRRLYIRYAPIEHEDGEPLIPGASISRDAEPGEANEHHHPGRRLGGAASGRACCEVHRKRRGLEPVKVAPEPRRIPRNAGRQQGPRMGSIAVQRAFPLDEPVRAETPWLQALDYDHSSYAHRVPGCFAFRRMTKAPKAGPQLAGHLNPPPRSDRVLRRSSPLLVQ